MIALFIRQTYVAIFCSQYHCIAYWCTYRDFSAVDHAMLLGLSQVAISSFKDQYGYV